jgi:hypothetical protein
MTHPESLSHQRAPYGQKSVAQILQHSIARPCEAWSRRRGVRNPTNQLSRADSSRQCAAVKKPPDSHQMLIALANSACQRLLASQRKLLVSSIPEYFARKFSFSANDSGISVEGASFSYRWLRDSCQCPSCIHPSTSQKLHKTSDIYFDIKPTGIKASDEGLHVEWMTGHSAFYATTFLERHSSPSKLFAAHRDVPRIPWDVSTISKVPNLFLPYRSLQNPSSLLAAITQLSQLGLLFVTGVPNTESSDQTCELRTLAQLFGEIRNTFYGELWDVKNVRNSRNIAYTNLDLGLHMDLLYVGPL